MSVPNEIDWALIKLGDGATPVEVFTVICGIQDVQINQPINTTDRFVRDCEKPGEVPNRMVRVNGKQLDISGSGLSNSDTIEDLNAANGRRNNYRIELYRDDGTDAGELVGTYSGVFVMTSTNLNLTREGDGSSEIALASHGAWTYAPAPAS